MAPGGFEQEPQPPISGLYSGFMPLSFEHEEVMAEGKVFGSQIVAITKEGKQVTQEG